MELPVVTLNALVSHAGMPFSFPGALRGPNAHSNLILAEVGYNGSATVRLDAVGADGTIAASMDLTLQSGEWALLADVLHQLGLDAFGGQIRVTQLGGTGILDGALATLTNDGGFAISAGFNP